MPQYTYNYGQIYSYWKGQFIKQYGSLRCVSLRVSDSLGFTTRLCRPGLSQDLEQAT